MNTPVGNLTVPASPAGAKGSTDSFGVNIAALRHQYLDLTEKCLINQIYEDPWTCWHDRTNPREFDPVARQFGRDWPVSAHTMIGLIRLRNIRTLIEEILQDNIAGDFIETGVWRGGACIYMRAILAAYGVQDRKVFVADSFEGYPLPNPEIYPADTGARYHELSELAVSLEKVQANFAKYGLLDDQSVFLKGWFKDTLPAAPIERLALLRLDGDMYESTMDALHNLYDKVSPGGYVIVDDYADVSGCQRAVADFRAQRGITDPIHDIDGNGAYWQKSVNGSLSVRQSPYSPYVLPPVASKLKRPFWTVIVPVCNRLQYLSGCLDSILQQNPSSEELEIIVHDDCSTVDVESVVRKFGKDMVRYERTATRLGLYANTNEAVKKSSGHWIHMLHDDDFVMPDFYQIMKGAIENLPAEVGLACCQYTNINEDDGSIWSPRPFLPQAGLLENWLAVVAVENPLNIPAVVMRRAVFETIGLFSEDLDYTGDWEFWVRSAMHFRWWYQPDNLARYRIHAGQLTAQLDSCGRTTVDVRKTIERISTYLPQEVVDSSVYRSRLIHATRYLAQAQYALREGNRKLAINIAGECAALCEEVVWTAEFRQLFSGEESAHLRKLTAGILGQMANQL